MTVFYDGRMRPLFNTLLFLVAGHVAGLAFGCAGSCSSQTTVDSRPTPSASASAVPPPAESVIEVEATPPEPVWVQRPIDSLKDLGGASWQVSDPSVLKSSGHISFYRDVDTALYPYRFVYRTKDGAETNCGVFANKQVDPLTGIPWWVAYCEGALFTKGAITAARLEVEGIDEHDDLQRITVSLGVERLHGFRTREWP